MRARWVGRCDYLSARHLDEFDEGRREVSYDRFQRLVGSEEVRRLEADYGYSECPGLSLRSDYCVSFYTGRWRGKKAVCMLWSAYHHIWLL